ncbi:hypothetical protein AB2B41_14010 [Marimonas sp. MJW-29]|uniref:Uncharacterized protein n=1 Tax=Sulfitobacter sediminis TaxID=3234186 RepID=A0ABV3RP28_9RHOB
MVRVGVARLAAAGLCACWLGFPVPPAVAETQAPLSVIDWLGAQGGQIAPQPTALANPDEPPVARTATVPDVNVTPLGEGGPRLIGLVPSSVTGLPENLWTGSDPARLARLIADLPDLQLPAAQALLYTVLLAEARAPGNRPSDGDKLALARVEKLVARGALDPALSLVEQAGVTTTPAHFELWMRISLLTGTEDRACAVLDAAPHLTQDYGTRMFCDARASRWENAALTYGSAQALGLMPPETLEVMGRFLDPETADGLTAPEIPRQMDPLTFRLFEAIGEPVPTGNLPRPYAVADLRDIAGWKAQIEAAERLTRAGALPDNRLLGLYTDRKPAASGGVWDRVSALQRFETALASGSSEAVAKTLPAVWKAMQEAGLEVTFAALFAEPLAPYTLAGEAGNIAEKVQLLSPAYEVAGRQALENPLAARIALGEAPSKRPGDVIPAAIHDAFTGAPPRADLVGMVAEDRLGEAILQVLDMLHEGAGGKARALTDALATLRALGLEDTARRAALQILLLER